MKKYVIFGDSDFAERISKYIIFEKRDKVLCFTNESNFISRKTIGNLQVIPYEELLSHYNREEFEVLICIGYSKMNALRENIYNKCKQDGLNIGSWISTNSITYSDNIGEGTIIMPNVLIGPTSEIGICNIIAASSTISHDNTIGNFNFLSTNVVLGGHAKILSNCFIGLNSTIKDSITINNKTLVGAASNVLSSTKEESIYIGNPAKIIDNKKSTQVNI